MKLSYSYRYFEGHQSLELQETLQLPLNYRPKWRTSPFITNAIKGHCDSVNANRRFRAKRLIASWLRTTINKTHEADERLRWFAYQNEKHNRVKLLTFSASFSVRSTYVKAYLKLRITKRCVHPNYNQKWRLYTRMLGGKLRRLISNEATLRPWI